MSEHDHTDSVETRTDHGRSCSLDQTASQEELADPRLISIADLVDDLGTTIGDVLLDARDTTLERLETEYGDAPIAGVSNFDGIARNAINVAISDGNVQRRARPIMETALDRTLDRLGSDVHAPRLERTMGIRERQDARSFARNVEFATRNTADDMLDRMRTGVRHGGMRGETVDTIAERVRDEYSAGDLRNRARLIARMELQTAVQSTKLTEYERSSDVDGYRIINPCTSATTPLCEHLAGCGPRDAAVVYFDDDDVASQLQDQADNDLLFEGFDPLPLIPPFHFNCRSGIAPVVRSE